MFYQRILQLVITVPVILFTGFTISVIMQTCIGIQMPGLDPNIVPIATEPHLPGPSDAEVLIKATEKSYGSWVMSVGYALGGFFVFSLYNLLRGFLGSAGAAARAILAFAGEVLREGREIVRNVRDVVQEAVNVGVDRTVNALERGYSWFSRLFSGLTVGVAALLTQLKEKVGEAVSRVENIDVGKFLGSVGTKLNDKISRFDVNLEDTDVFDILEAVDLRHAPETVVAPILKTVNKVITTNPGTNMPIPPMSEVGFTESLAFSVVLFTATMVGFLLISAFNNSRPADVSIMDHALDRIVNALTPPSLTTVRPLLPAELREQIHQGVELRRVVAAPAEVQQAIPVAANHEFLLYRNEIPITHPVRIPRVEATILSENNPIVTYTPTHNTYPLDSYVSNNPFGKFMYDEVYKSLEFEKKFKFHSSVEEVNSLRWPEAPTSDVVINRPIKEVGSCDGYGRWHADYIPDPDTWSRLRKMHIVTLPVAENVHTRAPNMPVLGTINSSPNQSHTDVLGFSYVNQPNNLEVARNFADYSLINPLFLPQYFSFVSDSGILTHISVSSIPENLRHYVYETSQHYTNGEPLVYLGDLVGETQETIDLLLQLINH